MKLIRDFAWNGEPVDEGTRKEWIEECRKYFESNPKERHAYVFSGDTMVIGMNRNGLISIYDCVVRRKIDYQA